MKLSEYMSHSDVTAPRQYGLRPLFLGVFAIALTLGVAMWAMRAARRASCESECAGHLKAITIALLNYEASYGTLPPAYTTRADGTRMHSWRVLILPFLEQERLFRRFRLDEPWNSPGNLALAAEMPKVYRCPNSDDTSRGDRTNYLAVVGNGTGFPCDFSFNLRRLSDRQRRELVLLVEVSRSEICWLEPRDLGPETPSPLDAVQASNHDPHGPGLAFSDGHCSRVKQLNETSPMRRVSRGR